MFSTRVLRSQALLCTLLFAVCVLITHPFVEMGQCDDFSYVRSAKTLAETGHVVYYGWASAMLGWQLFLGALFIKLFGFSFTAANSAVLFIALITTFLLQRTCVRLGLTEANATFATLTIVLSPLFLPLSLGFMSDVPGLFTVVLSLYLCLRAIQAPTDTQTTRWIIAASVASAFLGTARQTGWLGVLVLVPSTIWIVRKRRLPFAILGSIWLLSITFIIASLTWFNHQMYSTVETSKSIFFDGSHLAGTALRTLRALLESSFFLVPILIGFIVPFVRRRRGLTYFALAAVFLFCAYYAFRPTSYWVSFFLTPTSAGGGNYVTEYGILDLPEIGIRPLVLSPTIRVVLTCICYFSAFACCAILPTWRTSSTDEDLPQARSPLSTRNFLLLLVPFSLAYCSFLGIRVLSGIVFDRYLMVLFMMLTVIATRYYQDAVSTRLPKISYAALILFAAFAVAGTHDMFAEGRARLTAINNLLDAGIPRTAFYGGFPYDGWTQIDARGFVDVDDIQTPTGIRRLPDNRLKFMPCKYWHARFYPAIRPEYVLSYDNYSCGEDQVEFPPVSYRLWLPPFSSEIYTRKVSPESLGEPAE